MAAFFYFLEHVTQQELVTHGELSHEVLSAHGLGDVLADVRDVPDHCVVTPSTRGPSGGPGVLLFPITPGNVPRLPAYAPDSQSWDHSQIGNRKGPAPWIGHELAAPPRPEELLRKQNYPGYLVTDPSGRGWSVPMIRGLDRPYGTLPCDWQWPGDGFEPTAVLRDRYRQLWEDSAKVWDWCYVDGHDADITPAWVAGFISRCLAINHRVGPRELNRLRVIGLPPFDAQLLVSFAGAAVDINAVLEYTQAQKKTPPLPMPAGEISTPGTPGGMHTGDQPAANCESPRSSTKSEASP